MKNVKLVALILFLNLTAGCHLLPGNAEYFQKKVKALPTPATQPALVEAQKQAADFLRRKVDEAKTAAASTQADVSVQQPLADAATVASPLSASVGLPTTVWTNSAPKLADVVSHETATLDKKVAKYAASSAPLVGKKIDGTGLFQIGFFTQWALVLGAVGLVWVGLKAYGLTNPLVGAGTKVAERVGSNVAATAFHQVVKGGEAFLSALKPEVQYTAAQIKELFVSNHRQNQDSQVQDLVQRVTALS